MNLNFSNLTAPNGALQKLSEIIFAHLMQNEQLSKIARILPAQVNGKKVALFGSYGWGGGEWMNPWKADAEAAGLVLVAEPLAIESAPDEAGKTACADLGKTLIQA